MNRVLLCEYLIILSVLLGCKAREESLPYKKPITLSTLLDDIISVENDPLFPIPYYSSKLITSHDRRSVIPNSPSWHANEDSSGFIRYEANNGRVEKVLFDEIGPGVITRIITTGQAEGSNLRIYFDDEKEASILIKGYDISKFPIDIPNGLLLKHEHYPTTQGSSFYYPIPYGKRCKITVDNLNRGYYFHANYRKYKAGTQVKTFSIEEGIRLGNKAAEVAKKLWNPKSYNKGEISVEKKLYTDSLLSLKLPNGFNAIRTINFKIDGHQLNQTNYAQLMRGLIVKITFDGKQTVWAPLSDFSGAGMGAPKVDSWYLNSDGRGNIIVRFVMPYKKTASIELENLTKYPVKATIIANISKWTWFPNTLYFHSAWKQQRGLKTNIGLDYTMANITGRGVFKGDVLSIYNYSKRWYGEGDEHIWIDDENFPSHFGCGTEDYYNTTFAPIHVYHTPFGGAPREDNETSTGYNTFIRTRNLDAIPFNTKLKFDFELISWDDGLVDYSSTVYWYGDINSKVLDLPYNSEVLETLPLPIFEKDISQSK